MKVSIMSVSYPRDIPGDADDDCWGGFVLGCRGRHHRSVYMAEHFAERLAGTPGIEVEVKHAAKEFWNGSSFSLLP